MDLVSKADLVAADPMLAVASGCRYLQKLNISAAEADNMAKVTLLINGCANGIDDRAHLLDIAKQQMGLG